MRHGVTHGRRSSTQLTVRGLEPELERRLRALAREEGVSLNQAALELMRRGAGLEPSKTEEGRIGARIERYLGTWSASQAAEFDRAIQQFERVDEDLWK